MTLLCLFCGKVHPDPVRGGKIDHEPDACYQHRLGVGREVVRRNAIRAGYRPGPIKPGARRNPAS